ncbi:MAG: 5-formyltetrahydrofolate cyclo-ligase [Flavobacteriaceae bacterium]|nr:5-formyltetrahydrofolate cyclo-ligase [Flavobacteriaceae bacterium]
MQRGNKQELRSYYSHQRFVLSDQRHAKYSEMIINQTRSLNVWSYQNYHVYLTSENPNHKEVKTFQLIDLLWKKKKQVFVPKVNGQELEIHPFSKNTLLRNNQWFIPEPTETDKENPEILQAAFLPLIVADQRGYRLGYGKGYYDRFLNQCVSSILKIGLGFFAPIQSIEDVHSADQKLNYLITPKKIYEFD